MEKENIKIIEVDINDLKSQEINPRKWSKKEISDLTDSIKTYGLVDPVLCNSFDKRKNIVLGGHFRLSIAKQLGYKTIPVVYLNIPDLEKEKELCLRLNRNTGSWDWDLLREFDINLLLHTGFDDNDLNSIWNDVLEIEEDEFNKNGEPNGGENNNEPFEVNDGDIFELGNNRLMCGDSTNLENVKKLVGQEKISTIYCDPPYNINLDYQKGVGGKKEYGDKIDDKLPDEKYKEFISSTIKNALSVCEKNCHVFYWCDEKYIGLMQQLFKENNIENKRVCFWVKNNANPTPNIAFNKVFEPCVYGTCGKPFINKEIKNFNEILNKEIGTGNELTDDILDLFNIWIAKRLPATDYEHPTSKPLDLNEKPFRRCTKINDIILDLFGGSGSTLLSAIQLKRRCFLIEKQSKFIKLIIKRYEQYTGEKAKKLN